MKRNQARYFIAFATFAALLASCGVMSKPPSITAQSISAGEAGSDFAFRQFLRKSDELSQDKGTESEFASILMETQLQLLRVNQSETNLVQAEKGYCVLFYQGATDLQQLELSSDFKLSDKARVIYTSESNFESASCQAHFETSLPDLLRNDFFSVHVSFFSMTH